LKSWEFTWVPWLQTWECLPMQTDVEEIGCYYSTLQSKQIFHKKEKRVSLLWRDYTQSLKGVIVVGMGVFPSRVWRATGTSTHQCTMKDEW
jgi:hypothetical protein